MLEKSIDRRALYQARQAGRTDEALAFWRRVADGVARGERALLVGEDAQGIVGTVQLVLDQMPNQPHRADLAKMLVHRRGRRQGWGAALMGAAERVAQETGKTLLVLDTANDEAARLYARLGWREVGVIPNYALFPDGAYCPTTAALVVRCVRTQSCSGPVSLMRTTAAGRTSRT